MGREVAESLFGKPEKAVGQVISIKSGKKAVVVGLIKKQGKSLLGGFEYDKSIIMSYNYMKTFDREEYSHQ